jgi:hypothetical protein
MNIHRPHILFQRRAQLWTGALLFASAAALGVRGQAQQQPAPQTLVLTPHQACCGAITPDGYHLRALIDSMHVDTLWQSHLHVNWETGEQDRPSNYSGHDRATHCSDFAAAVGERLGVYMLRPPDHPQTFLASAQARWFHDDPGVNDGWKPLEGPGHEQQAQQLANRGNLVVIVYESPDPDKPGHIAVVRPSEKSPEALAKEGPQVAQAGAENHSSSIASLSFTHHPGAWPNGVRYYWHAVDWTKAPASSAVAAK